MVQSPSWEANWFAASQEIPRISRNPKVHYRTHKRPPTFSILGQPNPTKGTDTVIKCKTSCFFKAIMVTRTSLNVALIRTVPVFFVANYTVFGEYRSYSSSLCSFQHSPVTSSLLRPIYSPQHLILIHPQPTFFPQWERPSFTPIQNNRQNYSSVYFWTANWK